MDDFYVEMYNYDIDLISKFQFGTIEDEQKTTSIRQFSTFKGKLKVAIVVVVVKLKVLVFFYFPDSFSKFEIVQTNGVVITTRSYIPKGFQRLESNAKVLGTSGNFLNDHYLYRSLTISGGADKNLTFTKGETLKVIDQALQQSNRSISAKVNRAFKKLIDVSLSPETIRGASITLQGLKSPVPNSLTLNERLQAYDKTGILAKKQSPLKNRNRIRPESGKFVVGKNSKLPPKNDFQARLENQKFLSSLPFSMRRSLEIEATQIPLDAPPVFSEKPSSSSSDLKQEMIDGLPHKKTKSARKQDERSRIFVEGFPVASVASPGSQIKRGKLPLTLKDNSCNLFPTFSQGSKTEKPPSISPSTRLPRLDPKPGESTQLKQVSINKVFTEPQADREFVRNGKVDIQAAYREALRRANELGVKNFASRCSLQRFIDLATECGKVTSVSVKEAITILQGEMEGYSKDAIRLDYRKDKNGPYINGLDFGVTGLGRFSHITHADAKNLVGSGILKATNQNPDVISAAEKVGKRALKQKKFWSNATAIDEALKKGDVQNLNRDLLPEFPNSTAAVLDSFDLPPYEKRLAIAGFDNGTENDNNTIYLNSMLNI